MEVLMQNNVVAEFHEENASFTRKTATFGATICVGA